MFSRIDDYLDYHARVHAEVVFVTHEQHSFTFSRARARIDHIAGRLAAIGLAKGDRIALLGRNSIEFFFMYLACARLGVVPVGINYRLTPRECAFIIEDSAAKVLFADEELIAPVAEVCPQISAICLYGKQTGFQAVGRVHSAIRTIPRPWRCMYRRRKASAWCRGEAAYR